MSRIHLFLMLAIFLGFAAMGAACDDDEKKNEDAATDSDTPPGDTDTGDSTDTDVTPDGGDADGGDMDADMVVVIDIQIPGLTGPVDVAYDADGIPHITCAENNDCLAVQGYIHAQQRFFTMDLVRRKNRGRLSTFVGGIALEADMAMRHQVTTRDGQPIEDMMWEAAEPATRTAVEAYTRGINAWLEDVRNNRNGARFTREYNIPFLNPVIPDWEPQDSMAVGVELFLQLTLDDDLDLLLGEAYAKLPPDQAADIFGLGPATQTTVDPTYNGGMIAPMGGMKRKLDAARETRRQLNPWGDLFARTRTKIRKNPNGRRMGADKGSNNWVVAPALTTAGRSLLANDPHLGLGNPAIWYMIEMDSKSTGNGDLHVVGGSLPGVPGVVIGHNEDMAWGVTTVNYDLSDVYMETLNATNDASVYMGGDVPLTTHTFDFGVYDNMTGTVNVESHSFEYVPHHGPILEKDEMTNTAITLRWVAQDGISDLDALHDLQTVGSVADMRAAVDKFSLINQNWVFADRAGVIGWYPHSLVPQRTWATAAVGSWRPLPGDGTAEWGPPIPDAQLPQLTGPIKNFISTANNDLTGALWDGDPTNNGWGHLQSFVAPGHRAQRIEQLIVDGGNTHTMQTMTQIQADVHSRYGETIVPFVLTEAAGITGLSAGAQELVTALQNWGYTCPTGLLSTDPEGPPATNAATVADSIGCSAFQVLQVQLIAAIFDDELQAVGMSVKDLTSSQEAAALQRLVTRPMDGLTGMALWDDVDTPMVTEVPADIIAIALEGAATRLQDDFGPTADHWRWGRQHTVTLESPLAAFGIPSEDYGPFANDGGTGTVDVARPGGVDFRDNMGTMEVISGYTHGSGASIRIVNELSDQGITATFELPGGQDLHRDSPFYNNFMDRWLRNQPTPLLFERAAVEAARVDGWVANPSP